LPGILLINNVIQVPRCLLSSSLSPIRSLMKRFSSANPSLKPEMDSPMAIKRESLRMQDLHLDSSLKLTSPSLIHPAQRFSSFNYRSPSLIYTIGPADLILLFTSAGRRRMIPWQMRCSVSACALSAPPLTSSLVFDFEWTLHICSHKA
jgi:hypothetical protein